MPRDLGEELEHPDRDDAFDVEIRSACRRTSYIAGVIISTCFVAWAGFDFALEPANARAFLVARVVFDVPVIIATIWLRRPRSVPKNVERLVFAMLLAPQIAIAWMIGRLDGDLEPYLVGYSLVVFGSAFLIVWHWQYTAALSIAVLGMGWVSLWVGPRPESVGDLATLGYYLGTAGILAVVCQRYRYDLARKEHAARADLLDSQARNVRLVADLEKLSREDGLTGLANRRHWDERLTEMYSNARRSGDALSVVVFDVDQFKSVNDFHGHPVGDEVLCWVAKVLSEGTRAGDTVARLGGDEFAVLCPGQSKLDASVLVRRLTARFGAGGPVAVTVSAGVAQLQDDDPDTVELMRRADQALYESKFDRAVVESTREHDSPRPATDVSSAPNVRPPS